MAVASYCCYEKVRRTMRNAVVSDLLFGPSFSAGEMNNIESEEDVFAQESSFEQNDYGDMEDEDI